MPKFGKQSERVLITCHIDLQRVAREVIKGSDFSVVSGHRTPAEQADLVRRGLSLTATRSKHLADPSEAMDLAPYPIDWRDQDRFLHLAGRVLQAGAYLGVRLRWGGDWDSDGDLRDQNFMDLGHFELAK